MPTKRWVGHTQTKPCITKHVLWLSCVRCVLFLTQLGKWLGNGGIYVSGSQPWQFVRCGYSSIISSTTGDLALHSCSTHLELTIFVVMIRLYIVMHACVYFLSPSVFPCHDTEMHYVMLHVYIYGVTPLSSQLCNGLMWSKRYSVSTQLNIIMLLKVIWHYLAWSYTPVNNWVQAVNETYTKQTLSTCIAPKHPIQIYIW